MTQNVTPVRVHLSVEINGSPFTAITHEIPREEWDAMSVDDRNDTLAHLAEQNAGRVVTYGWNIEDADDMAATFPEPAITTLIEASSLGTPEAVAARTRGAAITTDPQPATGD